ncbi:MAG: toll/interleukin-1 receptor domain-containing protein, partial [Xanthobacteraceae bacterium]
MAGIFINYRHDDAPGVAGRLFDHLAGKFSHRLLFMDVDAMKPGRDFVEQLDYQVSQCRALLAIIGPHWLDAKDHDGKRRLDADDDYVRIELSAALKRDIPVIPVLVDGAIMPAQDRLPRDLQSLARRHALELRHTRFNADADAIVHALEAVVPRSRIPWTAIAGGAVVTVGIAAALFFWPLLSARLHPAALPPSGIAANPPTTAPAAAPVPPANPSPPPASA